MKTSPANIESQKFLLEFEERFFAKATIPYSKPKEEVWLEISPRAVETHGRASLMINVLKNIYSHGQRHVENLGNVQTHGRASQHAIGRASLPIAASVIILLGIVGFLGFYTKTINTGNGEHLTATLPDHSTVTLNAQSTLKYHPYWWFVSRKVDFSGEGFFEVTKGKKFEVTSSNGKTAVLGTSFNIYSRNSDYKVTCFTGKVKVVSPSSKEVVLTPEYHAEIGQNGDIAVTKLENPDSATGWIDNMFNFTSTPLRVVFNEIGRQYGVSVESDFKDEFVYTGYFSKDKSVDTVLNLICKPFGLTFVKKSDKQYLIVQQ